MWARDTLRGAGARGLSAVRSDSKDPTDHSTFVERVFGTVESVRPAPARDQVTCGAPARWAACSTTAESRSYWLKARSIRMESREPSRAEAPHARRPIVPPQTLFPSSDRVIGRRVVRVQRTPGTSPALLDRRSPPTSVHQSEEKAMMNEREPQ